MKIATFNINGINGRLEQLLAWLALTGPDVVCLQELKCSGPKFPAPALAEAGYGAVSACDRGFNGVAILARDTEPVLIRDALPGSSDDGQSRYIEAAVGGIVIASLYLPNGNPQPGPKFTYKLAWFERLISHAAGLKAAGVPVVLAGDYNVVPTDLDIYPTRSWTDNALLQPESRQAYRRLVGQGWVDALRRLFPKERIYTFWDYKRNRWQRDAGLRIDHLLLSRDLAKRLVEAGVDRAVRGLPRASDHAPVWIRLR
ncbi:exodeoxyribonuclease III [Phreatobacter stygius]|uniref:Exodeoxyribonuclease III n=1 Tax=Phreatobacter stygius TaxID=1940610 RepID=A0A4D7BL91_9HYPH|nr:exodeoxyribonuclease III [Phreatobacter stygius]QCI68502.1 exodeoxyribonuclease III [Phreatobacter stygius]